MKKLFGSLSVIFLLSAIAISDANAANFSCPRCFTSCNPGYVLALPDNTGLISNEQGASATECGSAKCCDCVQRTPANTPAIWFDSIGGQFRFPGASNLP
ncbi:MAG: hypothetical protein FWG80_01120 [Alphaproteobacteria bacterium]|nr:hypothetical protein [Alphaproteobacteria bacterium]